jgi:PAS domain S-box-containing protein
LHWSTGVAVVAALLFILSLWLADRLRREAHRHRETLRTLHESQQGLKLMADNATCMVLAYDMDRKLLFANPAVEALTGYAADELEWAGFTAWVHPEDRRRMLAHWERLFLGGASLEEEYRLAAKNGEVKWVSAAWGPILDEAGRQTGVQGSERDITERKYNERALRASESRFRELLDSVPLAAVIVNLKGYVSFCNNYALALTGWTRDEVIGYPAHRFFDTDHRQQLLEAMQAAQKTRQPQTPYLSAIRTRDGGRLWFQWHCIPLRDAGGQTVGFASMGADVTARQGNQAQSPEARSDASLVAAVAHDLNNLLTVIDASTHLIDERLTEDGGARAALAEIREAGQRGFRLAQQLFALCRKPA